jgi:hypothetical protein
MNVALSLPLCAPIARWKELSTDTMALAGIQKENKAHGIAFQFMNKATRGKLNRRLQ